MNRTGTITYKTSSIFVKEDINTLEQFFSWQTSSSLLYKYYKLYVNGELEC
jgi:hypothetical protein